MKVSKALSRKELDAIAEGVGLNPKDYPTKDALVAALEGVDDAPPSTADLLEATPPGPVKRPGRKPGWLVTFPHFRSPWLAYAATEGGAWDAFRELHGIRASKFRPKVEKAPAGASNRFPVIGKPETYGRRPEPEAVAKE